MVAASVAALSTQPAAAQQAGAVLPPQQADPATCGTHIGQGGSLVSEDDRAVTTVVTTMAASVDADHTTYQISLVLGDEVQNVYTIYGNEFRQLMFPPAFQVDAPFGVDKGGVDPLIVLALPNAAYDSWLTVGIGDGDYNKLGTIGLHFESWNDHTALLSAPDTGGAVFWIEPDQVRCGAIVSLMGLLRQRFACLHGCLPSCTLADGVVPIVGH